MAITNVLMVNVSPHSYTDSTRHESRWLLCAKFHRWLVLDDIPRQIPCTMLPSCTNKTKYHDCQHVGPAAQNKNDWFRWVQPWMYFHPTVLISLANRTCQSFTLLHCSIVFTTIQQISNVWLVVPPQDSKNNFLPNPHLEYWCVRYWLHLSSTWLRTSF